MGVVLTAAAAVLMAVGPGARAQTTVNWVAYHDHRPTEGVTHPNASGFDIRVTGDGGPLKNFDTGAELPVTVVVTSTGTTDPDALGANAYPEAGSPAANLFDGIVDVGNEGTIGVRSSAGSTVRLTFTNLDPTKKYTFSGTSARGGAYPNRWIGVTLQGAEAATEAHQIGGGDPPNLITKATYPASTLIANQAALNSGNNTVGSLVSWAEIDPGADGSFSILTEQYNGPHPLGAANDGPYGYALTAFALQELNVVQAINITSHPASVQTAPGQNVSFTVATTGAGVTYQWEQSPPGSSAFAPIAGATATTYSPGAATFALSGTRYRVVVTGQGLTLTSRTALLSVVGGPIEIAGLLKMDIYRGIAGVAIDNLLSAPSYPDSPSESTGIAGFDTRTALPTDALNDYGAVMSGFLTPQESGDYDFMLRSDDAGQLWLSTDDTEAGLTLIAEEAACCGPFEEPGVSPRTTASPVSLVAGRRYAVRALLKEGGGGDYLQVAWRKVGDSTPAALLTPIPAAYFSAVFPERGVITVTAQPQSLTAPRNGTITLSANATSALSPLLIQWQKNGVAIPGLTGPSVAYGPLTLADNGARFRAVISAPGATATTAEAVLTVIDDTTPPALASAVASDTFNTITVSFTEAVTPASAGAAANYSLDKGLTISGVEILSPTRVRLTTGPQAQATAYTLSISNIIDTAGLASAPGTSTAFTSFQVLKGGLKFEAWRGLGGTAIANLTEAPQYQELPDVTGYVTSANTRSIFPDDTNENFGARLSGWLVPTETGSYDFMLSSDDAGQLWLSTDDSPDNLAMIAEELACCGPFEEPGVSEATTATPIDLVANQRYFFQVLYKEGGGGDYAQVAWRNTLDTTPAGQLSPIPGSFFEIIAAPGTLTPPAASFAAPAAGSAVPEGTPFDVVVAATAATGKSVTRVEIFRGATRLADLARPPYAVTVSGLTSDVYTFTARVTDSAGLFSTPTPLVVSVGEAREIRNLLLMDEGTLWRYDRSGQDLGTAWREAGYDDSAWPTGPALIGEEPSAFAIPLRTPISRLTDDGQYIKTMYFRSTFNWTGPTAGTKLSLRHVVDDGAVVYLNGTEVHRFGITAGIVVDATTDALSHEQAFEGPFLIPEALLRQGTNLLAVEVHQNGGSSSDIVFGAELIATVPTGGGGGAPAFTRVERVGTNIQLEWVNGRLQSSPSLGVGTWIDVPGATSPYTAPATSGARFFRVAP